MTIPIKPIIMIIIVTIMIITAIITHINVSLSLYTWWYLMILIFRLYIYICMLAPPKIHLCGLFLCVVWNLRLEKKTLPFRMI